MITPIDTERIVRVFDPDPDADRLKEYAGIIDKLRLRMLRRKNLPYLMSLVSGICEFFCDPRSIADVVMDEALEAIESRSGSIIGDDIEFGLGVCVVGGLISAIGRQSEITEWNGWRAVDALAAAVWSALSFIPSCSGRRLEELRISAVSSARGWLMRLSSIARKRTKEPELKAPGRRQERFGLL